MRIIVLLGLFFLCSCKSSNNKSHENGYKGQYYGDIHFFNDDYDDDHYDDDDHHHHHHHDDHDDHHH
jgi:hypothetical protein